MEILESLKQLKVLLKAQQFALTGSFVVNKIGLCDSYSDIDIVLVNPDKETINVLSELQEKFPKNDSINTYKSESIYKFTYNELKIDAIISNHILDSELTYGEFIISPIDEIVSAKKYYKSPKHMFQLMKWRDAIISFEEIRSFIEH